MGLLVVQQATSMAVGTPTLGTAEGPLLIFSHCRLHSLPSISSLSILSWSPEGIRWGLLGFPLAIEIYIFHLGWHLTEAPGMSLQVAG